MLLLSKNVSQLDSPRIFPANSLLRGSSSFEYYNDIFSLDTAALEYAVLSS